MSSEIAIKVENLSKCYHIYDKPRDRLIQMLARGNKQYFREFWALRDASFEIKKGETVGIIGRNGSGKSTLLQMLCGTLNPTSGSMHIKGRIAALLELGSGFNPEFTGRENVYMNAAILGLSKYETDTRFNDIASFADIGDFIDQPVKTFSSGMMVRLAFAVAINVNPEILIVDEALSVGDELFQRKCFSRIEAIRAHGSTILFVSHSGAQIIELCDHAVLMDAGDILAAGVPKQIVGQYQKLLYAPADKRCTILEQIRRGDSQHYAPVNQTEAPKGTNPLLCASMVALRENFDPNLKPNSTIEFESHGAVIGSPVILTLIGECVNSLVRGRKYRYCYRVGFDRVATNVRFGMAIKTMTGLSLGGALSAPSFNEAIPIVHVGQSVSVEFIFHCHLNPGIYFMNAGVFGCQNTEETVLHRKVDVVAFRVFPVSSDIETETIYFGFESTINFDE
jgi:homopolymeric O-antigen transport system ATP-binding protein